MSPRPPLVAFTPLPPARNGIADYAATLLEALAPWYAVAAVTAAAGPPPPQAVRLDSDEADRRLALSSCRVLHQLGNNPDHGFVLRALRRHPGIVTLHDPSLGHLHVSTGEGLIARVALMGAAQAGSGDTLAREHRDTFARQYRDTFARQHRDTFARQHRDGAIADPVLFDHTAEVLARSRAVSVHSRFAQGRLRALHGAERTAHVAVVPHLLPPLPALPDRAAARRRLGLPADVPIVVTAGFAAAAKRLDWVLEAVAATPGLLWVQAGEVREDASDLAARLAARPELRDRVRITGWLEEAALTDHLAAADALVNLRFPSFGESSGSLARAFALGLCGVVSDTGAYAELPADAVLHIPLATGVPALTAALRAIAADPSRAWEVGAAGRRWARRHMALPAVVDAYRAVIEVAWDRPMPPPPQPTTATLALPFAADLDAGTVADALRGRVGPCRLLLVAPSIEALAERTLAAPLVERLPPWAFVQAATVRGHALLLELDLPWRP